MTYKPVPVPEQQITSVDVPEKAGSSKMPTIQRIRSSDLVKKRQISMRKA